MNEALHRFASMNCSQSNWVVLAFFGHPIFSSPQCVEVCSLDQMRETSHHQIMVWATTPTSSTVSGCFRIPNM